MANHHIREMPDLSKAEAQELGNWARRPTTARALAPRARIILASAQGKSDVAVAAELNATREIVGK